MLIAYSGGLHHVQVPGHFPKIFKTVRLRVENLEIKDYIAEMLSRGGEDEFKKNVMKDLDWRRDHYAPEDAKVENVA
jgi:hypothetical protein